MASSSEGHVKQPEDLPPSSSSARIAEEPLNSPYQPSSDVSQDQASAKNHTQSSQQLPWTFDFSGLRWNPGVAGGNSDQATSSAPFVPILCPVPFPGYHGQLEEQRLRSGGIFAVPMVPVIGPLPGYPPSGLIPISYNVPQNLPLSRGAASTSFSEPVDRAIPAEAQDPAAVGHQAGGVNIPAGVLQPGQIHLPDGQRHIVRRFHVAVQIDLLLILKLAAVVFIFSQDGSKDRLFLLLFLAVLAYLYQTGALSPILRWISQSAQRAMMPPQQQQAPARPAPVRPGPAERRLGQAANAPGDAPAEVEPDAVDNAAAPLGGDGGDPPDVAGDNVQQQPPEAQRARWWGFLKEVQMLVVGFVTSLLPGFHQHMD